MVGLVPDEIRPGHDLSRSAVAEWTEERPEASGHAFDVERRSDGRRNRVDGCTRGSAGGGEPEQRSRLVQQLGYQRPLAHVELPEAVACDLQHRGRLIAGRPPLVGEREHGPVSREAARDGRLDERGVVRFTDRLPAKVSEEIAHTYIRVQLVDTAIG